MRLFSAARSVLISGGKQIIFTFAVVISVIFIIILLQLAQMLRHAYATPMPLVRSWWHCFRRSVSGGRTARSGPQATPTAVWQRFAQEGHKFWWFLFILYIPRGNFVHPQPQVALCRGDKGPVQHMYFYSELFWGFGTCFTK
jgi:hypothetical protein